MVEQPLPNGLNGERGANGRFTNGNRGGPGNPYARRVSRIRSMILDPATSGIVVRLVLGQGSAGECQKAGSERTHHAQGRSELSVFVRHATTSQIVEPRAGASALGLIEVD